MLKIKEKALLGLPLNFEDKCYIYPPRLNEVIGNDKFDFYVNLLTLTKEDIYDSFKEQKIETEEIPSPWDYIILNSNANPKFHNDVAAAVSFFTHQPTTILQDYGILFGSLQKFLDDGYKPDELPILTKDKFFDFQNLIRAVTTGETLEKDIELDPNPVVRKIKEKARYRDKIKAKQSAKTGVSLDTQLVAICCMGLGLNPLNIGEITYVSFKRLFQMYQAKEAYESELGAVYAGAGSKIKPKYWITRKD